jgi:cation diffusion facilitator CzcD-associated flavoprotein CzcO
VCRVLCRDGFIAAAYLAVLGTGSTGIQASTAIARQAEHLYVLRRIAQFGLACLTPQLTDEVRPAMKARYPAHSEWQRNSCAATALPRLTVWICRSAGAPLTIRHRFRVLPDFQAVERDHRRHPQRPDCRDH